MKASSVAEFGASAAKNQQHVKAHARQGDYLRVRR
jgi:hypothetical protein